MPDDEQLSSLIGDIYDAALNPSLWVDVLGKARAFVVGVAASLYWKDVTSKRGAVRFTDGGIDPCHCEQYFDKYGKLDPTATGLFFAAIEEPMATADIVPYDEFVATRFYREWAQPLGLVDCVNVVLEKSIASVAAFIVFRHLRDGMVDDETRRRTRLLVPHIRRAALIGQVIDLKTAEAATFADTLDGLTAGIFLVDADGRIVHANVSAQAMLAAGDVLRAAGDRLATNDPQTDHALRDVFLAAGCSDAALGVKGVAMPLTARDHQRHVAHVLPLTSGARRRAGASYAAAAAMFVHKAALDTPSPPEVIAKAFKLTPSELRVLLAIVKVGGAPEVAEALGVAENTVKFHLKHLFEKTGTGRQADLVKLVAGFASPLAR
jgi:DNA-binding CsgD family transcriptional regulator/PAS domain-containing protein